MRPGDTRVDMLQSPAPAVWLHAMFFRPESSKANGRAHVMRSLVTAVISPRRFVGEASRRQSQGMDSLGALRPLPYPVTKLAGCGHHIRELTCSTLPLQISAPALSLAAICDRLPTDVGMMALRTVTSIRTIIHCTCLCLPQRFSRAAAPPWIRYLQSGAQRIECAQFSTPLSYSSSLVLHLIAAYTIATSGHFPIAHLSFCDPFLF